MFRPADSANVTAVARPTLQPSPAFLTALAILAVIAHALLAVTATIGQGLTADEIAHLTAGHAYNTRGDFRLQPENGNLPQRLAALPLLFAGDPLPPTDLESWRTADVWKYGHRFFFEGALSTDERLFQGRAMIALAGAATGLLIFLWSRRLFGTRGGFVSLALWMFCPAFLAHDALATSDATMTFFFLASVGAWWRHLERPGPAGAALSAGLLGLAFVAKFSAVLLPPMLALLGLGWAAGSARSAGWRRPLARLARTTALHAVVTWAVIWSFYGLRFSAFAPDSAAGATFNHGWGWLLSGIGAPARVIWWLKEWHVLPEAWLHGLTFVLQFSRARGAFMSGDYSVTGWVTFFPWAFLIKTPVPVLLLLLAGLLAALRRGFGRPTRALALRLRPLAPLAVLFGVYWATSLLSALNIGHRHILPTYPVLFIAAGWLGRWFDRRTPVAAAGLAALLAWHAVESWRARPHYLAYFNSLVGGSAQGWRHLVDSSLDWGQALPGLKVWLEREARGEKVYLSYFGTGSPRYEGIVATALPMLPDFGPPRRRHALEPGVYAIGATMLQHVYSDIRGEWTLEHEREFQHLRPLEAGLIAAERDSAARARLERDAPGADWPATWKRYEALRFARLCHYLRIRGPDASVGHSILIFRLTAGEIRRTTAGSARDWRAALEEAAQAGRPSAPR